MDYTPLQNTLPFVGVGGLERQGAPVIIFMKFYQKAEKKRKQHLCSSDIWPLPRWVGNGKPQAGCRLLRSGSQAGKLPGSRGSQPACSCPSNCLPRRQAGSPCSHQAVQSQAYKQPVQCDRLPPADDHRGLRTEDTHHLATRRRMAFQSLTVCRCSWQSRAP